MDKNVNQDELKHYQQKLLGILQYIDDICQKNGIHYFLAYGTLIGAVRHHGFIPWDDDADICLSREDYKKLCKAIVEDNDPRYKFASLDNDPNWYMDMARVLDTNTHISLPFSKTLKDTHVFVDVMPMDGTPVGKWTEKWHYLWMNFYKGMAYSADHTYISKDEKHKTLKKIMKPIASIFGAHFWGMCARRLALKRPYETSKFVQYGTANFKEGEITKEVYASEIRCKFENTTLSIPVGYDDYLRQLYGDYMQLPPEESRVPSHLFDIIDLGD